MDKSTIEYLKNIDRKRKKRNEIKEELIKKIKYFRGISSRKKEDLINKISEEFLKCENKEKLGNNIFLEVSKQNNENKERKETLTIELTKIKGEIQKEKRRYAMLKKMLVNEDFSGDDEYSIKKRKIKRDEIKAKVEQFNTKIQKLEAKKNDIEQEISQVGVVENKTTLHNSWKGLEKKETNYEKYSINELLNYDIGLSKELKKEIEEELASPTKEENNSVIIKKLKNQKNNPSLSIIIIIFFIIVKYYAADEKGRYTIISIFFLFIILIMRIIFKLLCNKFKYKIVKNIRDKRKINIKTLLGIIFGMLSLLIGVFVLIVLFVNTITQG